MNSLDETKAFLEKTAEELNFAKSIDRNEMYKLLIDQGNAMEPFPEDLKKEENFVKGCTSNVYIAAEEKEGRIIYKGSADAMIVRGYVSILIKALSGLPKEDIKNTDELIETFVEDTDVKASLTPSRANAFGNIFKMMKEKAQ
jgi:cysteine desulfuration protein SufE